MEETNGGNLFELFCGMIEAFDPCMDGPMSRFSTN